MKLTLGQDGNVTAEGFSPLENLIVNHRYHIGLHALAARELCESAETIASNKLALDEHAREINRRFGIVSGLVFALGVKLSAKKFDALMVKLEISPEELEELAQNAADRKPNYGEQSFAE